jgi:hypothetical protein
MYYGILYESIRGGWFLYPINKNQAYDNLKDETECYSVMFEKELTSDKYFIKNPNSLSLAKINKLSMSDIKDEIYSEIVDIVWVDRYM